MDWIPVAQKRNGCDHDNEPSCSIKYVDSFDHFINLDFHEGLCQKQLNNFEWLLLADCMVGPNHVETVNCSTHFTYHILIFVFFLSFSL